MYVNNTVSSEQTGGHMIFHIGYPSIIAELETTVKLAHLVLKISQSNIKRDPKKIWFLFVVVDSS
jgi:hypothetical protein